MKILNTEIPDWLVWLSAGLILYELGKRLEAEPGEAETLESDLEGDVMTCAAWQTVDTPQGPIIRCMYFEPACKGDQCLTDPVPYPPSVLEILEKREPRRKTRKRRAEEEKEFDREVKNVARMMAEAENEAVEMGKQFYKEILDRGGIKAYRKGVEAEEYRDIPKYIHRKAGLPPDEMASEMGYRDEKEFVEAIEAEKYRRSLLPKGRSYWKIGDFLTQAEEYVISQSRAA